MNKSYNSESPCSREEHDEIYEATRQYARDIRKVAWPFNMGALVCGYLAIKSGFNEDVRSLMYFGAISGVSHVGGSLVRARAEVQGMNAAYADGYYDASFGAEPKTVIIGVKKDSRQIYDWAADDQALPPDIDTDVIEQPQLLWARPENI